MAQDEQLRIVAGDGKVHEIKNIDKFIEKCMPWMKSVQDYKKGIAPRGDELIFKPYRSTDTIIYIYATNDRALKVKINKQTTVAGTMTAIHKILGHHYIARYICFVTGIDCLVPEDKLISECCHISRFKMYAHRADIVDYVPYPEMLIPQKYRKGTEIGWDFVGDGAKIISRHVFGADYRIVKRQETPPTVKITPIRAPGSKRDARVWTKSEIIKSARYVHEDLILEGDDRMRSETYQALGKLIYHAFASSEGCKICKIPSFKTTEARCNHFVKKHKKHYCKCGQYTNAANFVEITIECPEAARKFESMIRVLSQPIDQKREFESKTIYVPNFDHRDTKICGAFYEYLRSLTPPGEKMIEINSAKSGGFMFVYATDAIWEVVIAAPMREY